MKVVVGLSGGVDSAVTAYLLKEKGYDVVGVYLAAWCNKQAREDKTAAAKVAEYLGISFKVLDIRDEYKKKVIDYFFSEYKKGRVPSPDVVCNKEIKFGLFLEWARKAGFAKVATGHYAKLRKVSNRWAVFRPRDKSKDQTYFLYQLKETVLPFILWPLGDMTKRRVREIAAKVGLPNKDKPESMGICFVGEVDIVKFLRKRIPIKEGVVRLITGEKIGVHKGVWFYTLGQRHGFVVYRPKVLPNRFLYPDGSLKPLYVVGKDLNKNELIVSVKSDCMIKKIVLEDLVTIWEDEKKIMEGKEIWFRVRNLGRLKKGMVKRHKRSWLLESKEPIFVTSPGQSVVLYTNDERLVGGGVVKKSSKLKVKSPKL